jgi:hypothetical protein
MEIIRFYQEKWWLKARAVNSIKGLEMMLRNKIFWLLLTLLLVITTQAKAADVVNFDFDVDKDATYLAGHIDSAVFDDSNLDWTVIGDDGFGNVLQTYPSLGSTSYATALANNSYYTITITPNAGYTVSLSRVVFEVGKGGSTDPRGYFIRSSVDGFASDIAAETLPSGAAASPVQKEIALDGFQDLSSVTFRFYVYTPSPPNSSVDFRNMSFEYDLPATIPTLSEWGVIILSILLGAIAIRTIKRRRDRMA